MDIQGKHILVVTSVYPLSATMRYGCFLHEPILQLQQLGAKFTVFAPAFKGSEDQVLDGIKVYRFRYFWKPWEDLTHGIGAPTKIENPFYWFVAGLYILLGTWQLFWVCYRDKPDLLNVHWPFPHGLMALPASKILGIPIVFTFHGAELLLGKRFGFVSSILRWLIPMARGITVYSSFTKGLIEQLDAQSVPITIIPNSITIEPKPPKPRPPEQPPRLLFVGNLYERKGGAYLLEALPLVLAKHPVRLRLAGKGSQEQALKAQCQALGLETVVDFLGFVSNEELAEEYASCDIFILPSIVDSKGDTEGLGLVMVEAMAHRKPVIASAVGGIVDVVLSGTTGLLVPEKNPPALAEAILTLLADPKLAELMGQKGFEYVQSRFSWSYILPLWQKVFLEALNGNSSLDDV